MKHEFGGLWTRKKIDILEKYLSFYTTALKNKPFTLHYADAFAGTGIQSQKTPGEQEPLIPMEDLKGSVLVALETNPGFHRYHFNDLASAHVTALKELAALHPDKQILITEEDANIFVRNFCRSLGQYDRAVLFVDPYNTELSWETLRRVAETKKIDLWLLFPLSVILRMTPKDGAKIKPEWENTLNRLLGTNEWVSALYRPKEQPVIQDMYTDLEPQEAIERANPEEVQKWVKNRLSEIFKFVAEPVMLKNKNSPLFSFFFAVSNPRKPAWGLAQKAASHIIKKYA